MDKKVVFRKVTKQFIHELHALFLALDHVETYSGHNFIIFSDFKSALESLKSKDGTNPLVSKILERHNYLCTVCDKVIIYCWVPSHIGIQGNELADQAAKDGLDKRVTNIPVPFTDRKKIY